jgi:hypothetical protein
VAVNLGPEARELALPREDLLAVLAWDAAGVAVAGARVTLSGDNAVILGPR